MLSKLFNSLVLISLFFVLSTCEERESDDFAGSNKPALPNGLYILKPVICDSSKTSPNYAKATDDPKLAIARLLDFDGMIAHTVFIKDPEETIQLKDKTCSLEIKRTLIKNKRGAIRFNNEVYYKWFPPNCEFSREVGNIEYDISSTDPAEAFRNSTDTGSSIVNELSVTVEGKLYTRTTGYTDLTSFGCGTVDALSQRLESLD